MAKKAHTNTLREVKVHILRKVTQFSGEHRDTRGILNFSAESIK